MKHVTFAKRRRRAGFTALTGAIMAVGLFGMLGIAFDLGRMYIGKNETQTFVDSAALAATLELDGTTAGLERARSVVSSNNNRWNFSTQTVSNPVVEFSDTGTSNWAANPANPVGYRFARVLGTVNVDLFFLRVVNGVLNTNVASRGMSGQAPITVYREGSFPFSPLAHDITDPVNFGLVPGGIYTLRWASNPMLPGGNGKNNTKAEKGPIDSKPVFAQNSCYGDAVLGYQPNNGFDTYTTNFFAIAEGGGGEERGFIEESSASNIREAIEGDYQTRPLTIGSIVDMTGGAKNTQGDSIQNRVRQDTDSVSERYSDYLAAGAGNGRRIVMVPINPYFPSYVVLGFRAFFLLPANYYNGGGNESFCGEYIGSYMRNSGHAAAGTAGAYAARLME